MLSDFLGRPLERERPCRHMKDKRTRDGAGGWVCDCGHVVTAEKVQRGKRARKRGNKLQADGNKDAGIQNVGPLGLPEDGGNSTDWIRMQWKSGNGYPLRLDRWLRALSTTSDQLRAVGYVETPGPGKKARRLIVMDYDEFLEWFNPSRITKT